MKAAIVERAGFPPVFADFPAPEARDGDLRITVAAAALSPLARSRAAGTHYSTGGGFPFVAGVDGVGRLPDGRRVCFVLPRAPYGAMAEEAVVAADQWVAVPDDLNDQSAAAIANPGMSSWAALVHRARIRPGETVLVNGATGAAGRLAVRIARHLGAAKVIATGRNWPVLASLGADVAIALDGNAAALDDSLAVQFGAGVDIILDYLWGPTALSLLVAGAKASSPGVPLRFVQVGVSSGGEVSLPAAVLRSSAVELMGSGFGSVGMDGLMASIERRPWCRKSRRPHARHPCRAPRQGHGDVERTGRWGTAGLHDGGLNACTAIFGPRPRVPLDSRETCDFREPTGSILRGLIFSQKHVRQTMSE